MIERRLGRVRFLMGWTLLAGLHVAVVALLGGNSAMMPLTLGLLVLIQLAKVPLTYFRLVDVGRDPQDAPFFVLIPVVNFVGFVACLEATPSEEQHRKLVARWAGKLGVFSSFSGAAVLAARTALVGVPLAALYALGAAGGAELLYRAVKSLPTYEMSTLQNLGSGLLAIAALLGVYLAIQMGKWRTASRASWFPTVFLAPALFSGLALTFYQALMKSQLGVVMLIAGTMSWSLVWGTVAGTLLVVATVRAAQQLLDGGVLAPGEVISEAFRRLPEVGSIHGARLHAIIIGFQAAVLPGIFFALLYAFSDFTAIFETEKPALKRAATLSWGRRSRLFRMLTVQIVLAMAFSWLAGMIFDPVEVMVAGLIDPSAPSFETQLVSEFIWALTGWWLSLALYLVYRERVAEVNAARTQASR